MPRMCWPRLAVDRSQAWAGRGKHWVRGGVFVRIYTYIYMHMDTCIHVHMHTQKYTHTNRSYSTYKFTYTYYPRNPMFIHDIATDTGTSTSTLTHANTHRYMYITCTLDTLASIVHATNMHNVYMHICTYIYTCISCTCAHIHTHTDALQGLQPP